MIEFWFTINVSVSLKEIVSLMAIGLMMLSWFRIVVPLPFVVVRSVMLLIVTLKIVMRTKLMMVIGVAVMARLFIETQIVFMAFMVIFMMIVFLIIVVGLHI